DVARVTHARDGDGQGAALEGLGELLLGLTQRPFGLLLLRPLPEQREDQRALQQDDRGPGNEVPATALPERQLPVQDLASWRQGRFGNAPSLECSPIDLTRQRGGVHDGDAVGMLSAQEPRLYRCQLDGLFRGVSVRSADASVTEAQRSPC